LAQGDMKESGVRSGLRLIPGQALPGIRSGLYIGAKPVLEEMVE